MVVLRGPLSTTIRSLGDLQWNGLIQQNAMSSNVECVRLMSSIDMRISDMPKFNLLKRRLREPIVCEA